MCTSIYNSSVTIYKSIWNTYFDRKFIIIVSFIFFLFNDSFKNKIIQILEKSNLFDDL